MEYLTNDTDLTAVADAIRSKGGTTAALVYPEGFVDAIGAIETGGGGTDVEDGIITRTITSIENNRVTSVATRVFTDYTNLESVDFPQVDTLWNLAFSGCSNLKKVNFPALTHIYPYAFRNCSSLETVDFPQINAIDNMAFYGCGNLKTIILRREDTICELMLNAFANCYHMEGTTHATYNPTGAKDGYIYVPDDLVDSYKSATNWSAYASQIKPLSEYTGGTT